MNAVILCGGMGKRLESVADGRPKGMIDIGDKPILQHQVELLVKHGITDIILLVSYKADQIEAYFGDGTEFGAKIRYVHEDVPLGTAGAVKAVEYLLTDDFVVVYGDVMFDMDIIPVIQLHKINHSTATLVVHPNDHPHDSDLVELDADWKIIAIHPKPHAAGEYYQNMVSAGVYVLNKRALTYIPAGSKLDFGQDIFKIMSLTEPMYGFKTTDYLKDMGTPERLEQVRADYSKMQIDKLSARKAIFLDRDGVINKDTGWLSRVEDFELLPGAAEAISELNRAGYLVIVVTNQPVIAMGKCSLSELARIHKKMDTLLGQQSAHIDALYFCPHHPEKGHDGEVPELKIDCECRKPKPGLVLDATREHNIDLDNSYMVGDSWRDIVCGKAVGIKTVLIKTKEYSYSIQPNLEFDTLLDAVKHILGAK